MSGSQTLPPENPRGAINACRRRNALIQIGILLPTFVLYWWLKRHGFLGVAALLLFGSFLVVWKLLMKEETCPRCKNSLAMLPSEGTIRMPELSHAIRMCPYCGVDLSCPHAQPFVDESSSSENARAAINACRRRNGIVQICVLAVSATTSLCVVFSDYPRFAIWNFFICFFVGLIVGLRLLGKEEVCSRCKNSVSMLPSGGNFLALPELSESICLCPYCGADFSYSGDTAVNEVESPQL